MKDYKRNQRRLQSKLKIEKRLKVWIKQGMSFSFSKNFDSTQTKKIGGHLIEDLKNDIRKGKFWTFIKTTSTPCSCITCSPDKYKRTQNQRINKQIWNDLMEF